MRIRPFTACRAFASARWAITAFALLATRGTSVLAGFQYYTFDVPGAMWTDATGIDGGTIVETYEDSSRHIHGFIYNDSRFTTLDDPLGVGTFLNGISGNVVVGNNGDAPSQPIGFVYDGSTFTTLQLPTAYEGPNPTGVWRHTVVGSYNDRDTGKLHGFVYDGSTYMTLDVPSAMATGAHGIFGQDIVGDYNDESGRTHGFLYDGSSFRTIDPPGAGLSYATAVSGGAVVGYDSRGFGYIFDGAEFSFINGPLARPGTDTSVEGISGDVVVGSYVSDHQHGFIAMVPEPAAGLLLGICLAVVARRGRPSRGLSHG